MCARLGRLSWFLGRHIRGLHPQPYKPCLPTHNSPCGTIPNTVRGREGFRFEAIPDGLSDADRGKQDYGRGLAVSTSTRCAAPLRDLIAQLNATPGVPPVTCVLPTMLMSFALGVARELGIPTMAFWTASAAALMTHMRLRELEERGYVPLKGEQAHDSLFIH